MANATDWNEEKCIRLIREFRARPLLWDPKNQFYFRKKRKTLAWDQIGKLLNFTPYACKHKIGVLMSSFRREKSRIMNSIHQGDPSKFYTSNWFAFREMSFLIDKEGERKRQLTGRDESEGDENAALKKTLLKHYDEPPSKRYSTFLRITKPQEPTATSPAISEAEDEIRSFTDFIATKMKQYNASTKNAVQKAICEIIFKADQEGIYEEKKCCSGELGGLGSSEMVDNCPSTSGRVSVMQNGDLIDTLIIKEEDSSSE